MNKCEEKINQLDTLLSQVSKYKEFKIHGSQFHELMENMKDWIKDYYKEKERADKLEKEKPKIVYRTRYIKAVR
jgi:hypothetical protein